MNTFLKLVALLALILSAAQFVHAADTVRSPEEQAVIDAEAKAVAARKAVEEKKAIEAARKKADWNSKSFTEAWGIRGQAVLDSAQWTGGRAVQYVAKADATIGHYGFVVPSAYVATSVDALAKGAKAYADGAFDNAPKTEVAIRVGEHEVKASVPTPAAN